MFNQKEWSKRYYQNNKVEIKERNKKWVKANPEKIKKYKEKWRDYNLQYSKEYYEINKERLSDYYKKYYVNNREIKLKRNKKWCKDNPEKMSEYKINFKKTDKGKANAKRSNSKRRAIERNIINTLTEQEWLDILETYNYRCAYCGIDFDENTLPVRDHVIPISKGGDNTKENVVPSCVICNSKKGNRILTGGVYAN